MQTIQELGESVAVRRRALGFQQGEVAAQAGITGETLSRFERGRLPEFGARKLLAVLAVLGMELEFLGLGQSGSLDQLRRERNQAGLGPATPERPKLPGPRTPRRGGLEGAHRP